MSFINHYDEHGGVHCSIREGRHRIYPSFSNHRELSKDHRDPHPKLSVPNSILLFTVHNAAYEIDVAVIAQICSPYGRVKKVVIFEKAAGLQALVEMPSVESAAAAREALHGACIYANCCRLDVQFSNLTTLTLKGRPSSRSRARC